MTAPLLDSALGHIELWTPRNREEATTREVFRRAFAGAQPPLWRTQGATHATASCFAFDSALASTLLVFHRKGRFWVQPGGHLEAGDSSIAHAALRELREETGQSTDEEAAVVARDLDHHQLDTGFGACASHLDFGIAVTLDSGRPVTVSSESDEVRWWPVDALPRDSAPGLGSRMRSLLTRAASDGER